MVTVIRGGRDLPDTTEAFTSGPEKSLIWKRTDCEDAADMDDRGTLEITDAVYLLNFLFSGGPEPLPPHAAAGEDPTEDALGCRGF